jgi:DNA polymerase-4
MRPAIMHVDMDAFFSAVEELADPSLRDRPLAVAGPGERSIITTASYPARSLGVRTGMTIDQGRSLCRELIILRADYRKYAHASRLVMETLESFTPSVQVLSVDEAFLDITDLVARSGGPEEMGRKVKERVHRNTGLSCSVGIATNRLLAKLAGSLDKPDGLIVLRHEKVHDLLERTPVEALCGIGPTTAGRLKEIGIVTCGQLGRYPSELLRGRFGAHGEALSRMGRGEEPSGHPLLQGKGEMVKSLGHSVTLPRDLTDIDTMARVLLTLSEMVGRRIRKHGGAGSCLILIWKYDNFATHTRQRTFPQPIRLTREIYSHALAILSSLRFRRPVRLLGISLSRLSFGEFTGCLLRENLEKSRLQKTLDAVNDRFGEFSLVYAGSIPDLRNLNVISPAWRVKGIRNSF